MSFLFVLILLGVAGFYLSFNLMIPQKIEDPDEGVYLMVARLLHRGYPHDSFTFDQFLMFPQILALAFRIFHDSLCVGRLVVVAFSLAGLLGMVVLARQLGSRWTTAALVALVGVTEPYYFAQSRVVMADAPATACIVWALVCMAQFYRVDRRRWLGLSGALTAAALTIKPLTVVFAAVIGALLLSHRVQWRNGRLHLKLREISLDLIAFVVSAVLIAAPSVNFLDLSGEFRRTVFAHWLEIPYYAAGTLDRVRGLFNFFARTFMWLPFAIAGIARGVRFARSLTVALVAGELGSAALLVQFPPWRHHYMLLSPVLTVFAVVGLDQVFFWLKQKWKLGRSHRTGENGADRASKFLPVNLRLGLVILFLSLPWLAYNNLKVLNQRANELSRLTAYLKQHSAPHTYWLSDDAIIVYSADRLVPPSAMNLTFERTFKSYDEGRGELMKVMSHDPIEGIVVFSDISPDPKLISWIRTQFPVSNFMPGDSPQTTAHVFSRQ